MSDATPQSQSASKPRSTISIHDSYAKLHKALESSGADLRKPDALWKRAEESLAAETSDRAPGAAMKADLAPAQRALDEATAAYSWYARAITAAGSPPPEVRTLAEPLDAALITAQRKVALLRRKIDSVAPGLKHGENPPAPHAKLILEAERELINVAADTAANLAREVVSILGSDPELYSDHPERIPADVHRLIAETGGLDFLCNRAGGGLRVGQAFQAVISKRDVPAAVEELCARFFGRSTAK